MEVVLGYFDDGDDCAMNEYDLTKPPMSGIDYLKRVQLEAARCPNVVTAKTTPANKQGFVLDEIKTQALDESKSFPCERTQVKMAEDFSYIRQKFYRVKAGPSEHTVPANVRLPPACGTIQLWCRFCFGKDFNTKYVEANMKGNVTGQITNDGAQGQGNAPLLSILLKLNQTNIIKALKYHTTWLNMLGFSYDQGCWFYAILLCLDIPTPPNVTSALRELCRQVISIRNALDLTGEGVDSLLHQLNLLIVIVTKCFGQSDLFIV